MAKTRGPLMSFAAAGTVGKLATFRSTLGQSVAQLRPVPAVAPSVAQIACRGRFAEYMQLWRSLDVVVRARWQAAAASRQLAPHMLFVRECSLQRVDSPALPMIPAHYP